MNLTGVYLVGVVVLAYRVKRKDKLNNLSSTDKAIRNILLCLLFIWTVEFIGMRTKYNDTSSYIHSFMLAGKVKGIETILTEPYGGHEYLTSLVRSYTSNYHVYFVIYAIITFSPILWFFRKYSQDFMLTILSFLIFGWLLLSMAAMKQMVSIAFSLFAIDSIIQKKYISFAMWLLVAYTFHPYVLVLFIMPFFTDMVWSRKIIIMTIATFILCMTFSSMMGVILSIASTVGNNYSIEQFTDHTINPMRVVVDTIPIGISFVFRNKINAAGNRMIKLGVNMSIIAWLITAACLVGNPIYLYRTGQYFSIVLCVVFPWILRVCLPKSRYKRLIIVGIFVFYTAIFIYNFPGGFRFFGDFANHAPLGELFNI